MLKTIKISIISLSTIALSACMVDGTSSLSTIHPYEYNKSQDQQTIYPDSYDTYSSYSGAYNEPAAQPKEVVIPNSYHIGTMGGPASSKSIDKTWAQSQNPNSYTIEVASDQKPARVASVLYKAPKSERTAEIKTNNGEYKGLFGTYPSYEAAQEKLNTLPDDIKQNASIKKWNNVQVDINE